MAEQPPESIEATRQRIHQQAAAFAEATVYSLHNPYLTKWQKACVESIFQAPIHLFGFVLLGYLAFVEPFHYLKAFIVAAICSAVLAVPLWFAANITLAKIGMVFAGLQATIADLVLAGYMAYQRDWIGAAIGVATAVGIVGAIAPGMFVYIMLSRRLHPKYIFAKKLFGIRFPFEEHLAP